jgi:hypothetical protein
VFGNELLEPFSDSESAVKLETELKSGTWSVDTTGTTRFISLEDHTTDLIEYENL